MAVNVQDAINAVESHASSAQAAANTAQTTANNAATAAANAQAAIAELDSEKEPILTYARIISVLGFIPLSTCGYGSCYGLKYGGRDY